MVYKVGSRLYSATSTVEVIITRAPETEMVIGCHGAPMLESAEEREIDETTEADVLVGKRFANSEAGLELLCVCAGAGPLTADGVELEIKAAKPLPSSD